MSSISHWEVSFLSPYPTRKGQRTTQAFYNEEQANRMVDFYKSCGAVDLKIQPVGKEYQYPA
jgi:hypothetical protein